MDGRQLGISEDHHSNAFVSKHDGISHILWRCSIIYSLFLPGKATWRTPFGAFVLLVLAPNAGCIKEPEPELQAAATRQPPLSSTVAPQSAPNARSRGCLAKGHWRDPHRHSAQGEL